MALRPLVILNVVGLTPRHVGPSTPRLSALASAAGGTFPMRGVLPAVTCTAQATMLTGLPPQDHGIVGNGWFHRSTGEVRFWLQSNRLLHGEPLYAAARRMAAARGETFSSAKLFWWFNQGAAVDWSVTPKPHYGCDGSKELDIQSSPAGLAGELTGRLGSFPFHGFWGPMAGLPSSAWIASAAAHVLATRKPTLTLVYLPHLDYDLQRRGTSEPGTVNRCLREVDECAGRVIDAARAAGAAVMVVSEYGLMSVKRAVHLNRMLRREGLLAVRDGPFGEMLDTFGSKAFAVADHQIAHVYLAEGAPSDRVAQLLRTTPGVGRVLVGGRRAEAGLDHPDAGDIVVLAESDSWFAYPYWLDDDRAPDFARTVDIHRKPGYDPAELFFDPALWFPKLRVARRILAKKLGFRYRLDVVPLEAGLVRGSHGIEPADPLDGPAFIPPPGGPTGSTTMAHIKGIALEAMGLH